MLNRSFLGIGKGIMGDLTSSGFFLHKEMIMFNRTLNS